MAKKEEQETTMVINKSAVYQYIQGKDLRVSSEIWEGLNGKILHLIDDGIDRAKANKRQTVRACDF